MVYALVFTRTACSMSNFFPFDPVPRVIGKDDWAYLEQGLKQRVQALNKFLWDVYHEKKIIKDGIVPEEFVYSLNSAAL